jgi:hypothetical protein
MTANANENGLNTDAQPLKNRIGAAKGVANSCDEGANSGKANEQLIYAMNCKSDGNA